MDLRDYQDHAADWLSHRHNALLADEMGLGKTAELLAAARLTGRQRIVIVCPAVVCAHWMTEIGRWMGYEWGRLRVTGMGQAKSLQNTLYGQQRLEGLGDTTLCVVLNYDILKPYTNILGSWADLVIWDESHYLKNKDARRTHYAHSISNNVRSRGGFVWLASGTPMPNRPFELVEQLELIGQLEALGGWQHFVEKYCDAHTEWITVRGGTRRKIWKHDGATNLGELRSRLDGSIMLRRMRRDVMPDISVMPPQLIPLEISGTALSTYKNAEADLAAFIYERALEKAIQQDSEDPNSDADAAVTRALAAQHLVELSTLRQLIGVAKIDPIISWIEEWMEGGSHGRKIVVFSHHRETVERIHAHFDGSAVLYGGMDDKSRAEAVEKFTTGNATLMVASTMAAGIGINLVPCSDVAFAEFEWTASAHRQATDRCARHGQRNPVSVTYLTVPGTVDERMAVHIAEQMKVVDAVFGHENDIAELVMGDLLKVVNNGK